jgi:hypothetical protein
MPKKDNMTTQHTIILETDRLMLRRLVLEDLGEVFALYQDPEIRLSAGGAIFWFIIYAPQVLNNQ